MFKVIKKEGRARRGEFHCAHGGTVQTPVFMNVGTQAAIKGGHAEHIHASCDCEYAVRFDGRTSVAGYDPEAYLAQYNAAGGDINRMRRVNYAKNKERINAQKRAAYEARKTREDQ